MRAELQAKGRELLAVTKVKDDLQGKVTSANAAINSRDVSLLACFATQSYANKQSYAKLKCNWLQFEPMIY